MADLSRERIAEIRADAEAGHWVRHDPALILALLDAYERQRPRPANEVPDRPCLVQVAVHPAGYRAPVRVLARYYQRGWEQSDDPGPGAQYDDDRGVYLCPAGWYEARAEYGDDCSPDCRIPDADVRCWWPLPPLPKGGDDE